MTTTALTKPRLGSENVTKGVRIVVQPAYSSLESDPNNNYFKFVYRIRITNESPRTLQLISRHWVIVDADGERQEVHGEGVVGQQPVLAPGQSFEYASFCPLGTPWGTMEGSYMMREAEPASSTPRTSKSAGPDSVATPTEFEASIGRFFLVCPPDGLGDL